MHINALAWQRNRSMMAHGYASKIGGYLQSKNASLMPGLQRQASRLGDAGYYALRHCPCGTVAARGHSSTYILEREREQNNNKKSDSLK